jgi:predicted ATPase
VPGVAPLGDASNGSSLVSSTGHDRGTAGGPGLPRRSTTFVGRGSERAKVASAVTECRLVTLCGSGGCGKTQLALVVAEDLTDTFPDGIWFVDLSAVAAPDLVARAAASSMGVAVDRDGRLSRLGHALGDRGALVVLDGCEHVLDAAAGVADELLVHCPSVRILATSREELGLGPELVRRVEGLSLPETTVARDPRELLRSDAVRLFVHRGRSALDGFAPTGHTLELVAHICRRLDGLPLAIELAAALVGSLPVGEIATRIDDPFRLLDVPRRRAPTRQRTLRAALDWSFELLGAPERDLFIRLGVFADDFTLTAAQAIADTLDPIGTATSLRRLVGASMVECLSGRDGADRYRLLETMRHYANELLDRHPAACEVQRRHARHYVERARQADSHVHGPPAPRLADLGGVRAGEPLGGRGVSCWGPPGSGPRRAMS